eukprot:TRINITY_DN25422_c0_g2_i1.p1 TRINITY_DN25422_c0_g2~~TRINITY_DN25422_c0_g2_i1.p1  ORF type:complete len:433 (-),score=51.46 TRINITY_DN25422_c0_g2_i1:186-1484(-)
MMVVFFFFFSSRRRHTRCREVSWARRCVQETGYQRRVHGKYKNSNLEFILSGKFSSYTSSTPEIISLNLSSFADITKNKLFIPKLFLECELSAHLEWNISSQIATGWIHSQHCPLSINATLQVDSKDLAYVSLVHYGQLFTLLLIFSIIMTLREHSLCAQDQEYAQGISFSVIILSMIWNIMLLLAHLFLVIEYTRFKVFIILPFILLFVYANFIQIPFLEHLCHCQYQSRNDESLFKLKCKIYGVVLGEIFLFFNMFYFGCLHVIFFGFVIFPQIVKNIFRQSKRAPSLLYLLSVGLQHCCAPLYVFSTHKNFLEIKPDHEFCYALAMVLCVQLAYIAMQKSWGPDVLLPKFLIPSIYHYSRPITEKALITFECSICLSSVTDSPDSHQQDQRTFLQTPCLHNFHVACLKEWMNIRNSCPYCRSSLPPFIE